MIQVVAINRALHVIAVLPGVSHEGWLWETLMLPLEL
jgi:hypothetical protein